MSRSLGFGENDHLRMHFLIAALLAVALITTGAVILDAGSSASAARSSTDPCRRVT